MNGSDLERLTAAFRGLAQAMDRRRAPASALAERLRAMGQQMDHMRAAAAATAMTRRSSVP